MKIVVCEKCGGSNISSSNGASSVWDVDKQEWVLGDISDYEWCQDCECATNIEIKPAPFDETWSDKIKAKWMKAKIEEKP